MFLDSLSPLMNTIFTIVLLWFIFIIITALIKIGLLKTLDSGADLAILKRKKIYIIAKVFNIIISIISVIAILFFLLFLNNSNETRGEKGGIIHQAPLPENFKQLSTSEIKESNHLAKENQSIDIDNNAKKENSKAMDESMKLFKNTK